VSYRHLAIIPILIQASHYLMYTIIYEMRGKSVVNPDLMELWIFGEAKFIDMEDL
jgi:hypothetical protein